MRPQNLSSPFSVTGRNDAYRSCIRFVILRCILVPRLAAVALVSMRAPIREPLFRNRPSPDDDCENHYFHNSLENETRSAS